MINTSKVSDQYKLTQIAKQEWIGSIATDMFVAPRNDS